MTSTKIKVHYMDAGDDEVLAEIPLKDYYKLLKKKDGRELARELDTRMQVLNSDPKVSELRNADVFVSYSDVFTKMTFAAHLLEELSPELTNCAILELSKESR